MPKSKLPPKDSKEAKEIIKRYKNGEGDILWRELGFKRRGTLYRSIREQYKIDTVFTPKQTQSRKKQEVELPKPNEIYLPEIILQTYVAPEGLRGGDEEIVVLHCGDGHAGKITSSFDEDVYTERMATAFDSVMTIVTLHRKMYPIRKLWIPDCGDNVQGENPYQGSIVPAIKRGERDQIAKIALPAWIKLICSLKQEFGEVIFDGFGGNHGHERLAPETSRADFSLYDLIQAKIGDKKGITINIHENFGDVISMGGWRFFVTHLDGIPSHSGIPLFGIDKALKSWYMQFGGFDYAIGGHFHQKHLGDEVSAVLPDFLMCSTLVSDDDWALKKLKISSKPSQNIFGIHPRHGITWRYPLIVDKKYLQEKGG